MTQRTYKIDQHDPRLGRHVNHDERSKAYPAEAVETKAWRTVRWSHHGITLDQLQLGSCTGNAGVQVVNTEPNWFQQTENNEPLAVRLYSEATRVDPYPGEYPPEDTGSDGLSVCKVMKQWGWINSYTHAFGLGHAIGALMLRPVMTGTVWLEGMFNPDADGRVHVTGDIAGGHEYTMLGVEIVRTSTGRISYAHSKAWGLNSWGPEWGQSGYFFYTLTDYDKLLNQQGDVSVPVR